MNRHVCIYLFVFIIATLSNADTVVLRNDTTNLQGEILSGSINGLRLENTSFEIGSVLIPWSTIKSYTTNKPRPSLVAFLKTGDELWRAKHRLLRGDVRMAQHVFASALPLYLHSQSSDAQLVLEGALRCALSQGNVEEAVDPWLALAQIPIDVRINPFQNLTPVLDPTTMLCPHLPLVPSVRAALTSERLAAFRAVSKQDKNEFLDTILALIDGQEKQPLLFTDFSSLPQWQQIWIQYFIGISLLEKQNNADERIQGKLSLAKVASLPQETMPWLSGSALLKLSQAFSQEGNDETAEKLMYEVQRRYPSHPLLKN